MTLDAVKEILKSVKYPGMGRDLVSFGMVKEVVQQGKAWQVILDISTEDLQVLKQIKDESAAALLKAFPDTTCEVKILTRPPSKAASQMAQSKMRMAGVKCVLAVASGKGGVGKSTVATNLALALSLGGAKVGLMDADVYGPSLPVMYGLHDHPKMTEQQQLIPLDFRGIKVMSIGFLSNPDTPVIWRGPIVSKLIQQFLGGVEWGELDYLVIDLPPGTGDIQLTLVQSAPLTGAVIVTTPQEVALSIANKGLKMFHEVNVPVLGIVENMSGFVCGHCGTETHVFKQGGGARVAQLSGVPLLGSIPLDPQIVESGDAGVPVIAKFPDSVAAKAYRKIAEGVKEQIQRVEREGAAWTASPNHIEMAPDHRLKIDWNDGHQSFFSPRALRAACPCAGCVDEMTGQRIIKLEQVSESVRPVEIHEVGRYAVQIRWSDGHATGIYAFRYLRSLCECDACHTAAAAPAR